MNSTGRTYRLRLLSLSRIVLACSVFVFAFCSVAQAQGSNPSEAQWKSVGAQLIFSGEHEFTTSVPADGIAKGTITLRGPGVIGFFVREIGSVAPAVGLQNLNTGQGQSAQALGNLSKLRGNSGWVWEGQSSIRDFNPSGNAGGWVPGPAADAPTTTLEVRVFLEGGRPSRDGIAIEYEFWYLPLEGSQVVEVIKYGPNGQRIDVTPGTANNDPYGGVGDPSGGGLLPTADSHVYSYAYRNWSRANWGRYENLGAGWNPQGGERRAFLRFDLSGVDTNRLGRATLRLFHNHTGGSNSLSLGVYAITDPWQEGSGTYHPGQEEQTAMAGEISWVDQPSANPDPIAQFNPGPGASKFVEVDITPLVMAWLTGKPNHGLMIKPLGTLSASVPESNYGFHSRERGEVDRRPLLVLSGSGAPPGGGNRIANPSFEEGPPAGQYSTIAAGSGRIPGWTVSQSTVDLVGNYWVTSDGTQSVDMNGNAGAGVISQSFATVPGQAYRLTFDLSGNRSRGDRVMRLQVQVAGVSRTFQFDTTGTTVQAMGWRTETLDFTAATDQTLLVFTSLVTDAPYCGPAIDNVVVMPR